MIRLPRVRREVLRVPEQHRLDARGDASRHEQARDLEPVAAVVAGAGEDDDARAERGPPREDAGDLPHDRARGALHEDEARGPGRDRPARRGHGPRPPRRPSREHPSLQGGDDAPGGRTEREILRKGREERRQILEHVDVGNGREESDAAPEALGCAMRVLERVCRGPSNTFQEIPRSSFFPFSSLHSGDADQREPPVVRGSKDDLRAAPESPERRLEVILRERRRVTSSDEDVTLPFWRGTLRRHPLAAHRESLRPAARAARARGTCFSGTAPPPARRGRAPRPTVSGSGSDTARSCRNAA